jgi:hypothetical protein
VIKLSRGSIELIAWHRRTYNNIYYYNEIRFADIYFARTVRVNYDGRRYFFVIIILLSLLLLYSDGLALDNSGYIIDMRCVRVYFIIIIVHGHTYNSIVRPRYTPPPPHMRAPARRVPPN